MYSLSAWWRQQNRPPRTSSLAQGALCWILDRSPLLIPIPGACTIEQVQQNAAALEHGPLNDDEMAEIHERIAQARSDHSG